MPDRWKVRQSIYRELSIPAQCATYSGSLHEIRPEMLADVVKFFRAKSGTGFVPIQPYEYPFIEFQDIKIAHINGVYWQGDERIPVGLRKLTGANSHFIQCVDEWMMGQMNAFREKTVFRRSAGKTARKNRDVG